MTAARRPDPSPTDDLLAELGLPPGATSEEVEAAHAAVTEFLAAAPAAIRGWAHARAAAADEALLLLLDPSAPARPTLSGRPGPAATTPGGTATPPARRANHPQPSRSSGRRLAPVPAPRPAPAPADPVDEPGLDQPDLDDPETLFASVTPSLHRDEAPSGRRRRAATPVRPAAASPRRVPGVVRNLALVAAVGVGALAVAVIGYNMGGGGLPAASQPPAAAAPTAPALDQAVVADLMAKVQADPRDTDALLRLADQFYAAGQWSNALTWLEKLLAVEPDSVRGLLAAGATSFNLGDFATAEARWLRVVELDPDNLEGHYDLGFLYLNQSPADLEKVAQSWGRVVEIDPSSDLARIVSTHLTALLPSAAPGTSPGTSPAASPAATDGPAATDAPAASAAPSAEPAP